MAMNEYSKIPASKFRFVNEGERISDKKFDDKPIGYFRDALRRFCKSRASVIAFFIIVAIVLFSLITPLVSTMETTFMDPYYQKMGPRNLTLRDIGIMTGTVNRDVREQALMLQLAVGVGAEHYQFGEYDPNYTLEESLTSYYQPVREIGEDETVLQHGKETRLFTDTAIDTYLEVGFIYKSVTQREYQKILDWQNETGLQVLYPLIENNEYTPDATNANYWYKMDSRFNPLKTDEMGNATKMSYKPGLVLEDNYKRNEDGSLKIFEYTGGGSLETAQYRVRILYYNYYRYVNGFEPEHIFGTDTAGYDMALRVANGLKLSLLLAVVVSAINFVLGAMFGAVEGYYGGWIDLFMERVSDVLMGVPGIVVQTLFQIHLAAKVGPIVSMIFAFVLTGWIGIAYRVRAQFYRFKNQEYVMAARTLGARDRRIIWKHIFPNTLGTLITSVALIIPGVIFTESMLSYLGIVNLGSATQTSLGTLLNAASQSKWTEYPHVLLVPAIFISLLMISFNLFGNGLRDAFNPSLRGVEE